MAPLSEHFKGLVITTAASVTKTRVQHDPNNLAALFIILFGLLIAVLFAFYEKIFTFLCPIPELLPQEDDDDFFEA